MSTDGEKPQTQGPWTTATTAGFVANGDGTRREDNPYNSGDAARHEWFEGWDARERRRGTQLE